MSQKRNSSDRIFQTEHLQQNLKSKAVRGGSLTVGGQAARFVLRLLSIAVLARLLSPEDYGLMGMTLVVSGFVGVMADGGLIHATVQKENISPKEISLLFWINVAISLFFAGMLVVTSPLIAWVFGDPRLTTLLWLLSVTFVIGGLTVQHKALLRRNMRFGTLALIDIVSMLCGIVVAIIMAYDGWGYWALAWLEIAKVGTNLVLSWIFLRWVPSLPKWDRDVLSTLQFGGNIVIYNMVNYISRNADNALIGWYWGAASLGLYTRAYSLLMLPVRNVNAPFSAVAVPVLSRAKNDLQKLKRYFLEAAGLVAAVVIPIVACASVFADDLVRIFLGEKWMATADLFRLLSVPAMLFGASQPISWLYIVLDRTNVLRNVGLVSAPVNLVAFGIGLPYGPEGVATGYLISSCLMYYPIVSYALRGTSIKVGDVLQTWIQPATASIAGVAAGMLVKWAASSHLTPMISGAAAIVSFAIVYTAVMAFAFNWRRRVLDWYSLKSKKPQGVQSAAAEPVS